VSEGIWPIVALGELIESIEAGSSFRCRETPPEEGEVGVAKVSAVSWGRYDEQESKTCLDPSRINEELVIRKGDFLISRANTVELVGACVIAEQVSKQVMLSDKTLRIQFKDPSLKPWVLHFLRSRAGRQQIESLCTGNQESMRNISQRSLRQIALPFAPPEERQAMITFIEQQLCCVQATINTLQAIQAKLKQARASILKAAVEGRLVETVTPWSTKPLRELLAEPMRNGKSAKTSTSGKGVRIATLTAVTANQFTESNTKPADLDPSELDDLWLQPEDIFVQRSNAPELVGTSAMYSGQPNWAIFPDLLIRVRCSPDILPKWMLANLQAPSTRLYFKVNAKGSSGSMPKISQSVIAEAVIACPSLKDQEATLEELERRFSVVDQVEETVNASLRRCGQLRQAVLKRAFGG
jgi:type I restriction enzyme S subunit